MVEVFSRKNIYEVTLIRKFFGLSKLGPADGWKLVSIRKFGSKRDVLRWMHLSFFLLFYNHHLEVYVSKNFIVFVFKFGFRDDLFNFFGDGVVLFWSIQGQAGLLTLNSIERRQL